MCHNNANHITKHDNEALHVPHHRPRPLVPRSFDQALLRYQRPVDTPTLNDILVNFQLERLLWLRAREAEHDEPIPSIDSSVRTIDALLKRRERIEHKQAPADEATDEEKGMLVSDEEFQYVVKVYAENAYGPRKPDESPEKTAVRTSMRRSLGLPDEPDDEEKRMFPGAHSTPEPSLSTDTTPAFDAIGALSPVSLPVRSDHEALSEPSQTAKPLPVRSEREAVEERTARRSTSAAAPIEAPSAPAHAGDPALAVEGGIPSPSHPEESATKDPSHPEAQPEPYVDAEPPELVPIELPPYLPYWFNDPSVDYMEKRRWLKGRSSIGYDFNNALAKAPRGRTSFDSS